MAGNYGFFFHTASLPGSRGDGCCHCFHSFSFQSVCCLKLLWFDQSTYASSHLCQSVSQSVFCLVFFQANSWKKLCLTSYELKFQIFTALQFSYSYSSPIPPLLFISALHVIITFISTDQYDVITILICEKWHTDSMRFKGVKCNFSMLKCVCEQNHLIYFYFNSSFHNPTFAFIIDIFGDNSTSFFPPKSLSVSKKSPCRL